MFGIKKLRAIVEFLQNQVKVLEKHSIDTYTSVTKLMRWKDCMEIHIRALSDLENRIHIIECRLIDLEKSLGQIQYKLDTHKPFDPSQIPLLARDPDAKTPDCPPDRPR